MSVNETFRADGRVATATFHYVVYNLTISLRTGGGVGRRVGVEMRVFSIFKTLIHCKVGNSGLRFLRAMLFQLSLRTYYTTGLADLKECQEQ